MHRIQAEPLTPEAFAPFGEVVWAGGGGGAAANQGTAVRYDRAAALENLRPGARPNLAVFRSVAQRLPLEVKLLERHPHSTQTFLPLRCERYLVCVAPGGDEGPEVAKLRAFLCGPGQGVSYRAGVWHHPIVALGSAAELAMLAWEDGSEGDCEERALGEFVRVEGEVRVEG